MAIDNAMPGLISFEPLAEGPTDHVSATSIVDYLHGCKALWRRSRITRDVHRKPTPALVIGTAVHATIEAHLRIIRCLADLGFDNWAAEQIDWLGLGHRYRKELEKGIGEAGIKVRERDADNGHAAGLALVKQYPTLLVDYAEEIIRFPLPGTRLHVETRIDATAGDCGFDWKTQTSYIQLDPAKKDWRWDADTAYRSIQAGLYPLAIFRKRGKTVRWMLFAVVEKSAEAPVQVFPVPVTKARMYAAEAIATIVARMVERGIFPRRREGCPDCPLKGHC